MVGSLLPVARSISSGVYGIARLFKEKAKKIRYIIRLEEEDLRMCCRMVVACGKFPNSKLFDSFKLVALNRNEQEKHELNENNCNFVHGDGWGIVLGKHGRLVEFYKNAIACWRDSRFLQYYNFDADFVVMHARRKSPASPVRLSYVQPFEGKGWYFCHNGTIYDFELKTVSDSEQFFTKLLSKLERETDVKKAIKDTLGEIRSYSALNFILFNEEEAYILRKFGKTRKGKEYPRYYAMKYLWKENYTIISSERLQPISRSWEEMENGALFRVGISSGNIERLEI